MREDIVGRANVSDSAARKEYYDRLGRHDAYALWTVANDIEPWFPKSSSSPAIWRYDDMRPLVLESLDLVKPEEAGRRVVALENSSRKGSSACVGWLYTGLQGMRPGECTSAHNHAASALRFIMEGEGAYTVVDGHRIAMNRNDFVITPANCWHDHGVAERGEISIWQDGLDMLLVNQLEANFYAVHPDVVQRSDLPMDAAVSLYGGPGLLPATDSWSKPWSPMMKYEWAPTYDRLKRASEVWEGTPYDGVILQYVNPATGGPVMQTMGAYIQLLRPAHHTQAHSQTGSYVYNVVKGRGYSVIGGQRLDWSERDIFVVPAWAPHEHVNLSSDDEAILFSFTDRPVMEALGLYREHGYADNGGFQLVAEHAAVPAVDRSSSPPSVAN